jgi:hypothetical protein
VLLDGTTGEKDGDKTIAELLKALDETIPFT